MISLKQMLKTILTETMSFRDLWNASDPARKQRALHVRPKQMFSKSIDAPDSFIFSYKSEGPWSTTGQRWHGYVKLMKEGLVNNQNIEIQDVDCRVGCDCPDYRYRFDYGNSKAGASDNGEWSGNNGAYPKVMGERVGLCKHLMSLVEYLGTQVAPVAPEPEKKPPVQKKPPVVKKDQTPIQQKQLSKQKPVAPAPEPKPTSYYSDPRAGDMLQEQQGALFERLSQFVKTNPEFEVPFYDESEPS